MPQYQGVWTLAQAAQLQSTQRWATDPLYRNTTLLLQADNAANGAQNNTFLDSSSNNFTITRNGNTTQGTFTPFSQSPGWWGNYFDGSSYLQTGSSVSIGTSVFTLEFWVYATDLTSDRVFVAMNGGATDRWVIGQINTPAFVFRYEGVNDIAFSSPLTTNRWNHIAVVREGTGTNQTKLYLNGILSGTGTVPTNYPSTAINIGAGRTPGTLQTIGYLSNVRLVIGTAVYTSNFTPSPIPLTAVTNTSLLTCQSNRFVDNSTNNFTFTVNGSPSVQAFSPFAPQYQWTAPVISGSGYGGSGVGYLLAPASSNFQYPGDFSIETWVYVTTSNLGPIWGTAGGGGSDQIYLNNNTNIFYDNTNFTYFNSASSVLPYAWSHICITRQSGTLRMIINGVLIGSKAQAGTLGSAVTGPGIFIRASLDDQVGGPVYMADLRVCKGSVPTSYQTSSTTAGTVIFTPPTQAVTTTSQGATSSNVSLLLNFTNAGIYDGTMKNGLQTVGNAQVSTSVVKYGTGSMAFDGTGDYLVTPSSPVNILGSGDFTVEFWMYPSNTSSAYRALVASENYAATTGGWSIYQNGTSIEVWLSTATQLINATAAITATTWQHVALSRASGTVRLFVNGTSIASASNTAEWTGQRIFIGDNNYAGTDYFYNGYIDDLRITKGIARYTANFTPPTVALPRQ